MYAKGACSRKWGELMLTLPKTFLDKEIRRALEYKFQREIPDPLQTFYQYWDEGAWYVRKRYVVESNHLKNPIS